MAVYSHVIARTIVSLAVLVAAASTAAKSSHAIDRYTGASGAAAQSAAADTLTVILLGTGVGPPMNLQQFGASTLVEAGTTRLLFDCGRGATMRLAQMDVPIGSVSRVFLTHLHSD